jgi:hypothetical protein
MQPQGVLTPIGWDTRGQVTPAAWAADMRAGHCRLAAPFASLPGQPFRTGHPDKTRNLWVTCACPGLMQCLVRLDISVHFRR